MPTYNFQNDTVTTDNAGNVISSASLQPKPTIQPVTPTADTTNYSGITGGITESIINDYNRLNQQQQAAQTQQQSTGGDILSYMQQLTGKTADTQAANEAAGVNTETANLNKYAQQLADLNAQASSLNREAQAIPIQVQENNRNTGATDRGVAPQEAGALRLNALKALSIGQQSDIAAAAATGSQFRLQAARDKAQQIVDLKYKPLEDMVAIKQKQYDLNKDVLDSIDKKRSEALQVSLAKEAQDLADRKEDAKAIQNIAVEAARSGATPETLKAIQNAQSAGEAVTLAGFDLGAGFRQKVAQQEFDNKIQLAQVAISKANLAVSQGNLSLSRERLNFDKTKEAFEQAVKLAGNDGKVSYDANGKLVVTPTSTPVMQQALIKAGIDLTSGLLTDKGLNSAVGSNYLARFSVANKLSGVKSNFIGGVEQLRSQLTLKALQDAKSNGATFGALSDSELQILSATATKLGTWAIKDKNGNVTGYNINEKSFRQELDKINNFAKLDYVLKGGKPDEVGLKRETDGIYTTINSDGSITNLGN